MTTRSPFNDSADAVSRSRRLGAQSVAVFERGQAAIRETKRLLSEIKGTYFDEGQDA